MIKDLMINDYLKIENHGCKYHEYKISFKNQEKFYADVKDRTMIYWDFGDGLNNPDIELANVVAAFVRPHIPRYTKLCLKTIYLKYQRQDRPTIDCMADLLSAYINQFNYDYIQVPYIHSYHFKPNKVIVIPTNRIKFDFSRALLGNGFAILGDTHCYEVNDFIDKNKDGLDSLLRSDQDITYTKERNSDGGISSIIIKEQSLLMKSKKCLLIEDIIDVDNTVLDVINQIIGINPAIEIIVHCIFLLSEDTLNKIMDCKNVIKVEAAYNFFDM